MGLILRCGDVHGRCDYMARGETVEEVLRVIERHIRDEHGVFGITEIIKEEFPKYIHEDNRVPEETT